MRVVVGRSAVEAPDSLAKPLPARRTPRVSLEAKKFGKCPPPLFLLPA